MGEIGRVKRKCERERERERERDRKEREILQTLLEIFIYCLIENVVSTHTHAN